MLRIAGITSKGYRAAEACPRNRPAAAKCGLSSFTASHSDQGAFCSASWRDGETKLSQGLLRGSGLVVWGKEEPSVSTLVIVLYRREGGCSHCGLSACMGQQGSPSPLTPQANSGGRVTVHPGVAVGVLAMSGVHRLSQWVWWFRVHQPTGGTIGTFGAYGPAGP
jgi:hypothetical protein